MAASTLSPALRLSQPSLTAAAPLRVVVIDPQPLSRIGLCHLLRGQRDISVVGETGHVLAALQKIKRWSPDVVLIDPDVAGDDGPALIRGLLQRVPHARVIALGQHDGDEEIHRITEAGACGYQFKNAPEQNIVGAVRAAIAGQTCTAGLARQRLQERDKHPTLTPRECEVLRLLAKGYPNATIAALLAIAHGTVKLHVKSILAKLGVEDRAQAALTALRRGFARLT
ncbi:MAG TPA: response regulator transcription factor [Polyangia bacterium]|nr:response regulator transcription factor [Polyangia bacterium]